MSAVAVPGLWLPETPHIELPKIATPGEVFDGLTRGLRDGLLGSEERPWRKARDKLISWFAGFSDTAEIDVLDSVFGDHATINLYAAPTYLALTTAAVAETSTGSTITEANYTGYARKAIAAVDMGAATTAGKSNTNALTYANCTAGSSVVIGWAQCTAATVGNVILYGTCTSVTISTTQTPATIGVGVLSATLD